MTIKRYDMDHWTHDDGSVELKEDECKNGEWCKYEDVEKIIEENKKLKNKLAQKRSTTLRCRMII